jgi:hypothetical protein
MEVGETADNGHAEEAGAETAKDQLQMPHRGNAWAANGYTAMWIAKPIGAIATWK